MRFKRHINEEFSVGAWEALRKMLEKNCQPYIKQLKGVKSLLLRGSKKSIKMFDKIEQRQDRKPLLINRELSVMLDDYSDDHWGFPARSGSTFTTNRKHNARMYGIPYVMFPIGNFKYAWNDDVERLYRTYDEWIGLVYEEMDIGLLDNDAIDNIDVDNKQQASNRVFNKRITPILQKYKTSNLNTLLKQPGDRKGYAECIVNCKSYYMINPEWKETLIAWYGNRYWREK